MDRGRVSFMRFSVVHTTRYCYDAPVHLEPHVFRLRPRDDGAQRLLRHTLAISPLPAGRAELLDREGNVITQAWFTGEVRSLELRSEFEVETLRDNPFDFLLTQSDCGLPGSGEAGPVADFARTIADRVGYRTIPFLTSLTQDINGTVRQIVRRDGTPMAAEATLEAREGSCRDLAVLFCAACRTMDLTARFVSGYESEASLEENGELHAWAEVYLDGGGWRGFDPSRGLAVAASHVAVAASVDPLLAAPVTGSFRGSARSAIAFQISMQAG
jgi:transglutaminase-like putative cysteine protease